MALEKKGRIAQLLQQHEATILADWRTELKTSGLNRSDRIKESELREQTAEFLRLMKDAAASNGAIDTGSAAWLGVREFLTGISRSQAVQGFSPTDTATFVFSLKKPLFGQLRKEAWKDADGLAEEMWAVTELIDRLGMFTAEAFQKSREDVISRQQEDMLELSTPVVKLWDGVLALPMIGTLDSSRTQGVMETLLQKIVETGAEIAIIDITGVPTVDTLVAQHLIKTVTAARLMGADCIISGIRPQIAQTIVHLGVNLTDVTTKATLADAFKMALTRLNLKIVKAGTAAATQ
jgi:rsbT co-antagonist protein RsbR